MPCGKFLSQSIMHGLSHPYFTSEEAEVETEEGRREGQGRGEEEEEGRGRKVKRKRRGEGKEREGKGQAAGHLRSHFSGPAFTEKWESCHFPSWLAQSPLGRVLCKSEAQSLDAGT